MSKFKVGDKVRLRKTSVYYKDGNGQLDDNIGTITGVGTRIDVIWTNSIGRDFKNTYKTVDLQLANKGEQTMGRRTFRLLKEAPAVNKGALYQEACDDGDQPYELLDSSFHKAGGNAEIRARELVENNPKWFEEVFPLVPEYGNKAELEAFKKFAKKRK